jgi:hypothetical protein
MGWQEIVALAIVALTVAAFVGRSLRRRKFSFARHTHCGCVSSSALPAKSSIVFHARKGQRPEILIRER